MQVLWRELGKDEFGERLAGSEKGGHGICPWTSNLRFQNLCKRFLNTFGIKLQIYIQDISSEIQIIHRM